jgi:FAD/FMN-containing dehydrogenase/Fe-S oxidoreductase
MNAPAQPLHFHPPAGLPPEVERCLRAEFDGEILLDRFSRGRYSTDASIYQVMPLGVVIPRTEEAARVAIRIAVDAGVPVLPRGSGTSQCGQTVGAALVIDNSKYLNRLIEVDPASGEAIVQPGLVLDHLNAKLRAHKLWFPVDVSTSAQATIGGMAGNNSCGSRSLRYGNMVHNVLGVDAVLADGSRFHFGPGEALDAAAGYRKLVDAIHAIAQREAAEIAARWPKVLRRVQGYNLDMVLPDRPHNLAHLLVGSEGTLAYSQRIRLKLAPIPAHKVLGVCHFPTFYQAMDSSQHIVRLDPDAVELVDRTMIDLALGNESFRPVIEHFLRGEPDAILLVEFAGEDRAALLRKLGQLGELMGDLGLPGSVVEITDAAQQREMWEVRKAGLNIMMSMKGDGKPVSFIEDCAVPLAHLAEYTHRLTEVFHKHGTRGTWYAHASVGCLHVRPVLNMKTDGAQKMRAIAEEACDLVRGYKGAFSGEHGDGLVRSEWIEPMIGERLTRALGEIKALFDPRNLMNPGKIVRPTKMDDRSLFRYAPGYAHAPLHTALDWSEWGGLGAAVEMCNNNGHCRKFDAGTMCPSYRITGNEQDLTRGRANTLRLALTGQLGPGALTSDEMAQTMQLCVSCKGCKRECPTGVDMARMKIEFLHHYTRRHGLSMRQRLIAWLPRYAPVVAHVPWLANLRSWVPGLATLAAVWPGFASRRSLPRWRHDGFVAADSGPAPSGKEVVLLVDTFNRWFEPENAYAAYRVLEAAGYAVRIARPKDNGRPLCCGRTFLSAGLVDEARAEGRRVLDALKPFVQRGVPVVGLEPSCLLTLRDEYLALFPHEVAQPLAQQAFLFEEFLAKEAPSLPLQSARGRKLLLHGHCHQKAFGAMGAVERVLGMIPDLKVETIRSSCCGMAGAFGYEVENYRVSMEMAEADLLPAVREAGADTLLAADGVSCRHQIKDGTGREVLHVARILDQALIPHGG